MKNVISSGKPSEKVKVKVNFIVHKGNLSWAFTPAAATHKTSVTKYKIQKYMTEGGDTTLHKAQIVLIRSQSMLFQSVRHFS